MTLALYELCNASDQSMSPYCWRIRESLLLLEIPFESRLVGFSEIQQLSDGSNLTVPMLVDAEKKIIGSWEIAHYLSTHHDPGSQLFGDEGQQALAGFVTDWIDATLLARVNRMLVKDNYDGFRVADQEYFRRSEEARQGQTLEKTQAAREMERPEFQKLLHPARQFLKQRSFIGGAGPTYADFALHSTFQWARSVTRFKLLRPDDRLNDWIDRMDDWVIAQTSRVPIFNKIL
jgi:glutathione S-transferase